MRAKLSYDRERATEYSAVSYTHLYCVLNRHPTIVEMLMKSSWVSTIDSLFLKNVSTVKAWYVMTHGSMETEMAATVECHAHHSMTIPLDALTKWKPSDMPHPTMEHIKEEI